MREITAYDATGAPMMTLVQWDTGVYVYIRNAEITKAHNVHFFNVVSKEAYVVASTYAADGTLKAKIPSILLTQPHPIIGYIYVGQDAEYKSAYRFRLNMIPRPKPSDLLDPGTDDIISITRAVDMALAEAKASGAFDGADGIDGVDGKSAYQSYRDSGGGLSESEWIASLGQGTPEYVDTVDQMTDRSKLYLMPDGYLWAYMTRTHTVLKPNLFDRNECTLNKRLNSSGAEVDQPGSYITGYIPIDKSLTKPIMKFKGHTPFVGNGGWLPSSGTLSDRLAFYDSEKHILDQYIYVIYVKDVPALSEGGRAVLFKQNGDEWSWEVGYGARDSAVQKLDFFDKIAYVRLNYNWNSDGGPTPIPSAASIPEGTITVEEEGASDTVTVTDWMSTGLTYAPADYEPRIIALESKGEVLAAGYSDLDGRLKQLEESGGEPEVPEYWLVALKTGADEINRALEAAGSIKSAFLFYTDIHYDYGSRRAPSLLKYLYEHTAINKTIFGGDAVNSEGTDAETMSYLWDWRYAVKSLPHHHSVVGNHDDGNATNRLFRPQYIYAFLLAAEESDDIVHGGDFYYYVDAKSEKTRYLYLDTAYNNVDSAQLQFVRDALMSVPAGWHIVAVSHIWYMPDYDQYSVRPIPIKGYDTGAAQLLDIFDDYNARTADFVGCQGKVEFCVGGHVHRDYDGASPGGIPIILCDTDSRHDRGGTPYVEGTTTESSINGIIANYDAHKITVVRVGKGSGRTINC